MQSKRSLADYVQFTAAHAPRMWEAIWKPDKELGQGFEQLTIPLGDDPDGETDICATLVRYLPEGTDKAQWSQRPAMLYVHGLSDYFFQDHLARHYHDQGFAFFAVDLRKCGRSLRPGQHAHYATNMLFYVTDLNAAVDQIPHTHQGITVMAHSTGGLIVPLWVDYLRRNHNERHYRLQAMVLNSPWLGMRIVTKGTLGATKMAARILGRVAPHMRVPIKPMTAYGESLHKDHRGEWSFNKNLKPIAGVPVYFGWLKAVIEGQDVVHSGRVDCGIPIFVLCSQKSWLNKPYSTKTNHADVVLNAADIRRWSAALGDDVSVHSIKGARHDVFLSLAKPRAEAFEACDAWLREHVAAA